MLKKVAKFVLANPKKIFVLIMCITILFLQHLPRLRINSEPESMLPGNSEAVKAIKEIDDKFGGVNYIIALVESDNIFNREVLKKISDLSLALKAVPDVLDVLSITMMDEIKGVDMGIEVGPIFESLPQTDREIGSFKKYLLGDKRYNGIFVSTDCRHAIVLVRLSSMVNKSAAAKEIERIAKSMNGPEKIYLVGNAYFTKAIQDSILSDLKFLLPITAFVIMIVLYLSFRSFVGVFLPLLTVGLSTIWTLGTLAMFKEPLTVITTILPVILFSVGTAYALHIISRYNEEITGGLDKKEALLSAVSHTGVPVFLAAITTVFGFVSNFFTTFRPIKIFGVASALGVVLSFFFAIALVPIFLLWFPKPKSRNESKKSDKDMFAGFLKFISAGVVRYKSGIVVFIIIMVAFFAFGIPRIVTESNFVQYFKEGSDLRIGYKIVDDKFGGGSTFDILVDGDIMDPVVMKQIEMFEEKLKNIEHINYPNSIVDVLKEANKALNEGDQRYYKLPGTREAAAQYMLLLTMGGSSFLDNLITPDYRQVHITARMSSVRTKLITKAIKEVNEAVKTSFSKDVSVKIAGTPFVFNEIQRLLVSNQYSSLMFSFISVLLIITLMYRTWTSGIFNLVPIFVTVIAVLGIMGWFNIPLDMANTMVGGIAIGIGIDYSCHLFARYKEERKKGVARTQAVVITINSVGSAILYNAIAVGLGFMVLMFSSFHILSTFGMLIALAMAFSAFGALTILPVLILIKSKVKGEK